MNEKRIHDLRAAGAGDVGNVTSEEVLGPCPSCDAELTVAHVKNPNTGRVERGILHPVPFCTYYGETDPAIIERDVARAKKEN